MPAKQASKSEKNMLVLYKVNFYAFCGSNTSIFWSPGEKKWYAIRKKTYFIRVNATVKFIFWPLSRRKIVYDTGKTFILFLWLLPSLCSGIKLHNRNINFFLSKLYNILLSKVCYFNTRIIVTIP